MPEKLISFSAVPPKEYAYVSCVFDGIFQLLRREWSTAYIHSNFFSLSPLPCIHERTHELFPSFSLFISLCLLIFLFPPFLFPFPSYVLSLSSISLYFPLFLSP
ncbi:hypothetical protein HOLleu_27605 [Holothuria leucospilota]|uniref:Uncharacterized protein n=1 Tax=Holothuria leucospilota TaxID=206669 RepID=A0A9Q1BQW1_HOLLE|nr:hypothetical protein HOLleu_27605 [Holothuria leucospilota]